MALTIAAAQSASFRGDIDRNVSHHLEFAKLAAEHGVQLLVFPELSITGYELDIAADCALEANNRKLEPLRRFAQHSHMAIVVGAPTRGEQNRLHIAAFAYLPEGSALTYTKQHVHSTEKHVFTSGSGGPMLDLAGESIALAICADITHPEHAACAASRGATIYAAGALISEKGYPIDAGLMQQYASAHKCITLLSNHAVPTGGWQPAGKSAIWAPSGESVSALGTAETLVVATVQQSALLDGGVYSVASASSKAV